jgi:acyl-CoA synthetase (NDP forming)
MINAVEVARAIIAAGRDRALPILTCFMGKEQGRQGVEELRQAGMPVYLFPEEAARAMAGMLRYRRLRDRPEGKPPAFATDRARAGAILAAAGAAGRSVLSLEETSELLGAYGLPPAPSRIVDAPDDAIAAAATIGFPVVVKGLAEGLVHKTEKGAVQIDLRNNDDVARACREIASRLEGAGAVRYQVQAMVRGGHEIIIGLSHDPQFGPLLMCGIGGIFVEVLKDVAFRVLPITDVEARDLVRGLRGYPILAGARGGPVADEAFLIEALLRVGQMAAEQPEIDQLDINPLIVAPAGSRSYVVDARIRRRDRS